MTLATALDTANLTLNLSRGRTDSATARYARSLWAGWQENPADLSTGNLDSTYYNQGLAIKDALANTTARLGRAYDNQQWSFAKAVAFAKGVGSYSLGTDFDRQELNLAQSIQSFFSSAPLVFLFQGEAFEQAFDTSPGNSGGATGSWTSVNPDVDVENVSGNDSPSIGYMDQGDWLQFSRPPTMIDGSYRVKFKYCRDFGSNCRGDINGTTFDISPSGSWTAFVILDNVCVVPITSATTSIRFTVGNGGFNLDWFELTKI